MPPTVRQSLEYAEIREQHEQMLAQFERIRQRLELAMVRGEVMDRETFAPALHTAAGRHLVSGLVLRCGQAGPEDPLDLLGFRTLTGETVEESTLVRFQVVHPLHLRSAGTLEAWQHHLIVLGRTQPFNQIFREVYLPTAAEREHRSVHRLAGRMAYAGALVRRLAKRGWQTTYDGFLERRFSGQFTAELDFSEGVAFLPATEILTVGDLLFPVSDPDGPSPLDPLAFSEALRDTDLATASRV